MPTNKQMDNENVVPFYNGIFLALKKKNMKLAHKWIKLEKNIPSELSQTPKEIYSLLYLDISFYVFNRHV